MPRKSPELAVQVSIIKWLRWVMPKAMIHHSVNETARRGKAGMLTVARNKAAGMMPGFPDLIVLPESSTGPFFLEVKAPRGAATDNQKHVHDMLRSRGYPVAVVKSVDDVRDFLTAESIPFNEVAE